jgi:L-asparaginase/Glu-tRNA(Gln) amidotransferase subunit D
VLDTCAYPGGGHELRGMGAIFANHMTGQQARIELMLALGVQGDDLEAIRNARGGGAVRTLSA